MTDDNAPVRRAHRAAVGHLEAVHERRKRAQERAERHLTEQTAAGERPAGEPSTEVTE